MLKQKEISRKGGGGWVPACFKFKLSVLKYNKSTSVNFFFYYFGVNKYFLRFKKYFLIIVPQS